MSTAGRAVLVDLTSRTLTRQGAIEFPISISVGVSVLNKDLDEKHFLKSADEALYRAKESGRNQMVFASAGEPDATPPSEAPP